MSRTQKELEQLLQKHLVEKSGGSEIFLQEKNEGSMHLHKDQKEGKKLPSSDIIEESGVNGHIFKQIPPPLPYPFRAIGLIVGYAKKAKVDVFGTGALVAGNIVLTCAHNYYHKEYNLERKLISEEEVTDLKFFPSLSGKPEREVKINHVYYARGYATREKKEQSRYDFAILELDEDLSEECGYFSVDTSEKNYQPKTETLFLAGYPMEKQAMDKNKSWAEHRYTMWGDENKGEEEKTYIDEYFIYYKIASSYGNSGGPIFKRYEDRYSIVGIHIGGGKEDKEFNRALRLRPEIRSIINSWIGKTAKLSLGDQNLEDKELKFFAEGELVCKLEELSLYSNPITAKGIEYLATGKWNNLHYLSLGRNEIGDEGISHLLNFSDLHQLKQLLLWGCGVTYKGVYHLLSSDKLVNLRILNLGDNDLGSGTEDHYKGWKSSSIRKLYLFNCNLDHNAMNYVQGQQFPKVEFLDLSFNSFYETYFLKTWRNLHELYLESCTLDSQAIKELTNFEFPNLLVLDLENNPIGNEGVLQLKKLNGVATKLNIKGTNITDRILEDIFALKFSELKLSEDEIMGLDKIDAFNQKEHPRYVLYE